VKDAVAGVFAVVKWSKRQSAEPLEPTVATGSEDERLQARLDQELEDLD